MSGPASAGKRREARQARKKAVATVQVTGAGERSMTWVIAEGSESYVVTREVGSDAVTAGLFDTLDAALGSVDCQPGDRINVTTQKSHGPAFDAARLWLLGHAALLVPDSSWEPDDWWEELAYALDCRETPHQLNGRGAAFLRWDDGEVPVLVDFDEETFSPMVEVAEVTWHSEAGGAPISWSGGAELVQIAPGVAYARPRGDDEGDPRVMAWPEDERERATVVADWLMSIEAARVYAIQWLGAPAGKDAEEQRQLDAAMASLAMAYGIVVRAVPEKLVAEALSRSSTYQRVAKAVAEPTSSLGRNLVSSLLAFGDNLVLGEVAF